MCAEVTILPGDRRFSVAAGQGILEAALAAGLNLPYGCRTGVCGTCKARLLRGQIAQSGEAAALTGHEQQQGYFLPCLATARSDLAIEIHEPATGTTPVVRTLPLRVTHRRQLSRDVMGLWLAPPPGDSLDYCAGQYIDILLADGRRRSFSLAGAPTVGGVLELHVRHNPGGAFSEHVFGSLAEGELLRIEGPFGGFYLRTASTRPLIFVAGGTGFAPIQAILQQLAATASPRSVVLYWGVRTAGDLYALDRIESWRRDGLKLDFRPVYSMPDGQASGRTGLVHEALARDYADLAGFDVYTSGPPPMVKAVAELCRERGLPAERLYTDAFESALK